jgi:hypothetical protein
MRDIADRQMAWAPPTVQWTLAGVAIYVVMGIASLPLVSTVERLLLARFGLEAIPGTSSWGVMLAVHPVVWGLASVLLAIPVGRRLVPGLRLTSAPAAVLSIGLLLAAITTYLLHEFVRDRFLYFDPEYVGWALFAAPALVAVALSAWAAAAVPRGSGWPLFVAEATAAAGFGLAILPSLPGLRDGIGESSYPLVAILAVDAVYVLGALALPLLGRSRPTA